MYGHVSYVFFYMFFATVRYSLHKCSETILCWKWQFTIHMSPVFPHIGVHGSKKTCHWVVQTSILHPVTLLGPISGNRRGGRLTAKKSRMFRVQSRHDEFLVFLVGIDCGNCKIIRRAYINWYFRCSIVSLKLCKQFLNMATFKISLTPNSW